MELKKPNSSASHEPQSTPLQPHQANSPLATHAQTTPQTNLQTGAPPLHALPDARPASALRALTSLPIAVEQQAHGKPRATYLEMVEANQKLIQSQTEALKQVLNEKQITPADFTMMYGIDITGDELSVCLACGQVGHDYQPTKVRTENPEIDMLAESVVVFMEVAARAGVKFGVLAYDDGGVLTLRAPKIASTSAERAEITARFSKFKDRFTGSKISGKLVKGDMVIDQAWLNAEKKNWKPGDANRQMAGEPDDRNAIDTAARLCSEAKGTPGLCGLMIAKSQKPKSSLAGAEAVANTRGLVLSGIAVGKNGGEIRKSMFGKTSHAPTMHDLRAHLGQGTKDLVSQAPKKK